jgi:glycosyltransferase involved in cell wall biosynthesis
MKILIICHELPFPGTTSALTYRVLNAVKHLSQKYMHNITIVGFKYKEDPEEYLKKYCNEIVTITLPTSVKKRIVYYFLNYIIGIFLGYFPRKNIFEFRYSWKLQKIIKKLLETKDFDIVFVDGPTMLSYVSDISIPKVVEVWDISRVHAAGYKLDRSIPQKIYRLLLYLIAKNYEKMYEKFDICITPTEQERDTLKSRLPNLNISVIPFGINTDLRSENFEQDFPSLLFLGSLDSIYNQRSILYFYREIYSLIKEKIPNIKLYIVGKNPSKEILKLRRDSSVIVTGYVEDIRPYLARASVITLPIHGYGIKTRVLEAMAVGKPVVTSSAGIHGIDVTPEKNIIIADEPKEFAERVIELLNDEELRKRIGTNARKLMEKEYSWEKMTDMLNEAFQEVEGVRR